MVGRTAGHLIGQRGFAGAAHAIQNHNCFLAARLQQGVQNFWDLCAAPDKVLGWADSAQLQIGREPIRIWANIRRARTQPDSR